MTSVKRGLEAMGVAGALLGTIFLASARSQEYCVACSEPDATYRCVIDKAAPSSMPLKMLCISVLAREAGHSTCAIRKGTVFDCVGPVRRVDAATATIVGATAPSAPATSTPGAQATPPPESEDPKATTPRPVPAPVNATPKTVEQLAKDMTKSSGDALGKAGAAIAGTTKKAWGCVTSFFKSC